MKHVLYIVGILFICFLFDANKDQIISKELSVQTCNAIMKEKSPATDMQHRIEVIRKDLRNSNCVTPRRNVQSTNYNHYTNRLKNVIRIMHEGRMKEMEQLQKVSEYQADCLTFNYSALLRRMGYHVYALRKIII